MRVLVSTPFYAPHSGGVERVAEEEAVRLAQRGADVAVVTTRHDRRLPLREERDGVLIIREPAWNPFERFGVPWPVPRALRLDGSLLPWRPDVVVAHGHPYVTTRRAFQYAERVGARRVLFQHNTFIAYGPALRALQHANDAALGRWNLRHADAVIAPSEATATYVAAVGRRNAEVVRNGVDSARFTPAGRPAVQQRARARFGLAGGDRIAVTVRRLSRKNGLLHLLTAARHAPDVTFVLAGTGPDAALLGGRAPSNVRFVGFVPDADLPELLRAADAFVLPSLPGEGFPLAVLEAMAAGLPVVATASGGHTEILAGCGTVVPPADPVALARAVHATLAAPAEAQGQGARGRRRVESALTWRHHVDQLERVLAGSGPVTDGLTVPHETPVAIVEASR